jgi:hypothetical protein
MGTSESESAIAAFVNERLRAIEDQVRDLQRYLQAQSGPSNAEDVNVTQLSDEERRAIRSTLESNNAIGPSPETQAKILIMVDPPGVCLDYTRY